MAGGFPRRGPRPGEVKDRVEDQYGYYQSEYRRYEDWVYPARVHPVLHPYHAGYAVPLTMAGQKDPPAMGGSSLPRPLASVSLDSLTVWTRP